LKEKLIKIGAKVVSHGRYVVFQMAEVAKRPPAFPTRSRPRLVGTAMEISRFPGRRLR
jgi:hypothetical protein